MSLARRLNSRLTQMAVGPHLPHRTVRMRLTVLYGGLFLLSGAALMAIAYALLVNAGFVFTLQNSPGNQPIMGPTTILTGGQAPRLPGVDSGTPPSAQTMAHWRQVARCMRKHGVTGFPEPTTSAPANRLHLGDISDREGAIFAIPAKTMQSQAVERATNECGFSPDRAKATAQEDHRRTQVRQELLVQSGIALGGMSLLSLGLGWLMAGRVLQPLEDSYQAQRQFVANASHELRAPLTRQRALIEVALASSDASFDSLRRAHERVLASEQHLEQLIDGLLALTRGQAGLERREHLDLATLTSQAMRACESELAGLDLDLHATLHPAPANGDPRLFERLLTNLVDNAIRHNIPGGRIEINTGTRDRRAFVSIENTGPKVPSQQIKRLFQPFQRLGTARTAHDSGHGLGLSIVHAIANAHRAELEVRPRQEGGLAIEVSFPPAADAGSRGALAAVREKLSTLRTSLRDFALGRS